MDQQALAWAESGKLEEHDVGNRVVEGDCNGVLVADALWKHKDGSGWHCNELCPSLEVWQCDNPVADLKFDNYIKLIRVLR